MGKRRTWLGIALSATALDATVATYCSGVVWRAFAVVILSKLLLLLLAAVWATTLLHVWIHARFSLRRADQERRVGVSIPVNRLSAGIAEEIDV